MVPQSATASVPATPTRRDGFFPRDPLTIPPWSQPWVARLHDHQSMFNSKLCAFKA